MQSAIRNVFNCLSRLERRPRWPKACSNCGCSIRQLSITPPTERPLAREPPTPLALQLAKQIQKQGALSLPEYITQCLTHPEYGYYTTSPDPFGQKGDFTTSPEISQMFGEIVGIWILTEWIACGRPKEWDIIELGPGRGTLMADVVRTLAKVKSEKCFEGLKSIHLIETSPILREKQRDKIRVTLSSYGGSQTPIHFHDGFIDLLKSPHPLRHPMILAHEFLDALPIHAFRLMPPKLPQTQPSWRELLVTNTSPPTSPHFKLIPAETGTLASRSLPMSDLRYKKSQFKPGNRVEISSSAIQLIHSITSFLVNGSREFPTPTPQPSQSPPTGSGAALIIDYGPLDGIPSRSLRGISKHEFTSPFHAPGKQDLTADVDFGCIKDTALSVPGARVSGPICQGDWLIAMGLAYRADRLIKTPGMTDEKKDSVLRDLHRLAGKNRKDMGMIYKILAITARQNASEGFGGKTFP